MLRDLFNPTYENIYVNDETICKEVKDYVTLIAPEKANIVKMYTGKVPIFDNFNVTKQIKASFYLLFRSLNRIFVGKMI